MAETWEVILWVIAAIVLLVILLVVIAIISVCRKRNKRKRRLRQKGLEWGKSDETDYVKKVQYNKKGEEAKIIDEKDSGSQKLQKTKVQYNTKTGEANVVDVVDNETQAAGRTEVHYDEKTTQRQTQEVLVNGTQTSEKEESQQASSVLNEKFQSTKAEVTRAKFDESKDRSNEKRTEISQSKRERLQPIEVVQPQRLGYNYRSVNNYTNLGYDQTSYRTHDVAPTVQFQQPVAVVRAMVHPGPTRRSRTTKSLPRNYSKLSYKKSFGSSTIPRHKPLSYYLSLQAKKPLGPQSWINVPIRYKETHHPIKRRKMARHVSLESRDFTIQDPDFRLESQHNLTRGKFTKTIPQSTSRRYVQRRRTREKRRTDLRPPPMFNDVFIMDSQPSHKRRVTHENHYERASKPETGYHQRRLSQDKFKPIPEVPDDIVSTTSSKPTVNGRNVGDYYEESYKMVKRSEFPGKPPSKIHRDVEPDMVSISGSEFSDYFVGPPRPSDSHSDDHKSWEGELERKDYAENSDNYTYGSYKEYSSRLQSEEKEANLELESEAKVDARKQQTEDRVRHATTFQDTLETLKNGNHQSRETAKQEMTTQSGQSPWINNDNNFRKTHGVPVSGVPVLPPEPVFIQTLETDNTDD